MLVDIMALREVSSHRSFNGTVKEFEHDSTSTHSPMRFSVYLPPGVARPMPVYYLAGLTCDHMRFFEKASPAIETAARLGLALVCPDTSPRNLTFPEFNQRFTYGNAASMYVDATAPPFSENFNMFSYVTKELPALVNASFSFDERQGLMGHSMGGHAALLIGLKEAANFKAISALSPITNPCNSEWVIESFTHYFGPEQAVWKEYDSTELVKSGIGKNVQIRVDYGSADEYSASLKFVEFQEICRQQGFEKVSFHCHEGYDHGYYFVSSVVEEVITDIHQRLIS